MRWGIAKAAQGTILATIVGAQAPLIQRTTTRITTNSAIEKTHSNTPVLSATIPEHNNDLRARFSARYGTKLEGNARHVEQNPYFFYVIAAFEWHKQYTTLPRTLEIASENDMRVRKRKHKHWTWVYHLGEWWAKRDTIRLSETIFDKEYERDDGLRQYTFPQSTLSTINHEFAHKITDDLERKNKNLLLPLLDLAKNTKGRVIYGKVTIENTQQLLLNGFVTSYGTSSKYEDMSEIGSVGNTTPRSIATIPQWYTRTWRKIRLAQQNHQFPQGFEDLLQVLMQQATISTTEGIVALDVNVARFLQDHATSPYAQQLWLLRADLARRLAQDTKHGAVHIISSIDSTLTNDTHDDTHTKPHGTPHLNTPYSTTEESLLRAGLHTSYKHPIHYPTILQRLAQLEHERGRVDREIIYSSLLHTYEERKKSDPMTAATIGIDDLLHNNF